MNITYIVNVFPKISETFVLDQITYLIDQGHNVNIIANEFWDEDSTHSDVEKYDLLSKTIYVDRSKFSPGFEITGELIQTILFADVIHAHFATWPAETAMQIAKLTGIPFVFTTHAYDIFINPDIGKLIRMAESSSKLLTVTEYNKNYLLDLIGEAYRDKIEIIRCAINTKKLQPLANKSTEKIIILVCGRFVEKKGIKYALRAFANILSLSNVELRIIGDGPLSDEIETEIMQLGIKESVSLLGAMPHNAVFNQIKNSDIFLLPSITSKEGDREGLPVSLLEAQALGIPVISSIHAGIPEGVVDQETGFLVPEKDVDAITEKLETLLQSPALRQKMGKKGQKFIQENFNSETEFPKLEHLLIELTEEKERSIDFSQKNKKTFFHRVKALLVALHYQKKNEINVQSALIEKLEDLIRQNNNQIRQKQQQIEQTQNCLNKEIDTAKYLQEKVNLLDQKIKKQQEQINRTYKTLSWKITTPLRFIFSLLTNLKNSFFSFCTLAAKQRQKAHIAFCPDWSKNNAYQSLLYKALSNHGYSSKGIAANEFTFLWLLLNITKTKIIHLHWLNGIYDQEREEGFPDEKAFWFKVQIIIAKLLCYKIIWTVHNLVSHECHDTEAENSIRRFVAKWANTVIVHCEYAKTLAQQQWQIPETKIKVCPHGTYGNNYLDSVSKEEARKILEIDSDSFTFLFFGLIRSYKGLSTLLDCFTELHKKYPQIQLIVAGKPCNAAAKTETKKVCDVEGIYPFLRFIPDDEVQYFFRAADVAVLPYQKILTSGAVYLSISFATPVIVPDSGCIPELVNESIGFLYDGSKKGLEKAMIQAIEGQSLRQMSCQAKQVAKNLQWEKIVEESYLPLMSKRT